MLEKAKTIISKIGEKYPKEAEHMLSQAEALSGFQCSKKTASSVSEKSKMFAAAQEELDQAKADCPDCEEEIESLSAVLDDATAVVCGG